MLIELCLVQTRLRGRIEAAEGPDSCRHVAKANGLFSLPAVRFRRTVNERYLVLIVRRSWSM